MLDRYDWFLITRSDMMYPIPHPDLDLFSPEYVWVPAGERWGGAPAMPLRAWLRHVAAMERLAARDKD